MAERATRARESEPPSRVESGAPNDRTLVDRFVEFNRWPSSRKTVLLMAIALPVHLLFALVGHLGLLSNVIDRHVVTPILDAGVGVVLICMTAGWIAVRKAQEGRWTANLLILAYGIWVLILIVGLGVYITPFLAYPFLLPLLLAMWYDMQTGLVAVIFGIVASVVVAWTTLSGLIPFAPALALRQIDAMRTGAWFSTVFVGLLFSAALVWALCLLTVLARRQQELRLQVAQKLIRRYVPAQIAEQIISDGDDRRHLHHERRKLSIFFSDLVGFTDIAEELEPEDLSRVLNEYFSAMTSIANRHGGTVDELSGDAILILFGAPHATSDKDHALRAARMALEMQDEMQTLNAGWQNAGIPQALQVRMGINTGVVTVGSFGSPERMKYAAQGRHVNLAARLQSHCEPGKVLLSHSTWLLVQDRMDCVPKGEIQLKGIQKPVPSYELVSTKTPPI